MKAVVCLPTKNEIESIGLMLDKIKSLGLDVFVSDCNSTDGTQEVAREKGVEVFQRDHIGYGYGCGILNGFEVAKKKGYDVLVILDCDTTYPPESIPDLLSHIPEYDLVVGARPLRSVVFSHRLANWIHLAAINLLFWAKVKDVNSGMRAIRLNKFDGLLSAKRMDMVAQISSVALRNHLKVKEIPIVYSKRLGESKIGIPDGFDILWRIFHERLKPKAKRG